MKFAKSLEQHMTPEWRTRYFDYKQGKKKIKAITAALRNADRLGRTPPLLGRTPTFIRKSPRTSSRNGLLNQMSGRASGAQGGDLESGGAGTLTRRMSEPIPGPDEDEEPQQSDPIAIAGAPASQDEQDKLLTRYGSIVGTPPDHPLERTESLDLGDPALDLERRLTREAQAAELEPTQSRTPSLSVVIPQDAPAQKHTDFSVPKKTPQKGLFAMRPALPQARSHEAPLFRRMMSRYRRPPVSTPVSDIPLEVRQQVDDRYEDFLMFLDKQRHKIETFYKAREDEATARLEILRAQLHKLRDQRAYEIFKLRDAKAYKITHDHHHGEDYDSAKASSSSPSTLRGVFKHPIDSFKVARKLGNPRTAKPTYLATPSSALPAEAYRDYQRRPPGTSNIEYRKAKRKLKIALQEYYRGLELLRGYAESNRTAFRKINKKFDKAIQTEKKLRYYSERIMTAHFVKSDMVERHINDIEDLYSRYFENGNRKAAEKKLRPKLRNEGDFTGPMFRIGLLLGVGSTFAVYGLVHAFNLLLHHSDATIRTQTSYLLQIYAGYFLMLLMALLFVFGCWFMTWKKINYQYILEFEPRTMKNWRQLFEIPLIFYFLLGFIVWLNFKRIGGETMYIYWPVILIGLSLVILFLPFGVLYSNTRTWFLYSAWRLFFSSIYPVEFRDLFFGDLFCSLTYSMGNIELFFCLYANMWGNPTQCNSSNSRLLGFFSSLPGIWRAMQCLRRFWDTGALFPHMANCGKYIFTIMYYMTLSLYRINLSVPFQLLFIFFAAANAIYTTIWDLFLDWSLMSPTAKWPLLRDELPYKNPYYYYAAMVIDIIIRQNWICYAIFAHDMQHSASLSFFVGLSEVFRRGVWLIFRIENEHATNVSSHIAHKDKPLPYPVDTPTADRIEELAEEDEEATAAAAAATSTGAEPTGAMPSLLRKRTPKISPNLLRAGNIIRGAHAQDYERRRQPDDEGEEDEDDDDDDDAYVEGEAEHEAEDQVEASSKHRSRA